MFLSKSFEMNKIQKNEDLYTSLAHLFYSIATVDNRIHLKEKEKIKELVDNHWRFNIIHAGSDKIIYSTLNKLFKEKMKSEDAFLFFSNFYNQNSELFTEEIKNIILQETSDIALSFSGINKSESVLISRLYFLMNKNA